MKKLMPFSFILILNSFFIFNSCKKSSTNSLIGTWKFSNFFENGIKYELDDCEKQDTFIFLENGTFTETYYYLDESGNCAIDGKNSGSWSNKEKNIYLIDYDGEIFEIILKKDTFYIKYNENVIKKEVYLRQ